MKRWVAWVLGALVSGLLLWFALREPNADPTVVAAREEAPATPLSVRSSNVSARGAGLTELSALPLVPDEDRPGGFHVQGLVLDPEELPVEGATVVLDTSPPRSVRTGKDGTFDITGLSPRAYQVVARHGSLLAGPVGLWLNDETQPLVLHLRPAASLEVTVVEGAEARGVPGAAVELRSQQTVLGTTDAQGRALLQGLPVGRHVLKVSARGFAPSWQVTQVVDAVDVAQKVTVALRGGAAASGTVVDARGKPVAGVVVMPVPETTNTLLSLTDARGDGVETDARGAWRFEHLGAGPYQFTASGPRVAPGTSATVRLDGMSEQSGITITVPDAARFSGRVEDARGAPVPYAVVRVALDEGARRTLARQTTADARGAFEMEGLPQRRVAVVAKHERATSGTQFVDLSQEAVRKAPVVLVLSAAEVLRGRVESSSGQPVGEAVVSAELTGARMRGRSEQTLRGQLITTADPGGRFEFRGLLPGTYLLRAAPPGTTLQQRLPWLTPPVQAETGGMEPVLKMSLGGTLTGRVVREDQVPPTDFSVVVRGAGAAPNGGGDGRFHLRGVPAGEHTLYITGKGFMNKTVPGVRIQEGQETSLGDVVVQRGRQLQGRVVNASGAPVADATVTVSQPVKGVGVVVGSAAALEYGLQQVRTGPDGGYVFEGLPISPLQLSAEHFQEGRSEFTQLLAGVADQKMDLRLSATGQLDGTVLKGNQPVSGALIIVTNPAAPAGGVSGTTGTDGTFHFDNLAPATYSVLAVTESGGGQQVQRTTANIQAKQTARVDLTIPEGSVTVLVRAQAAEGTRAQEARVLLIEKLQGANQPAQVQALSMAQPARFEGVNPGEYQLCVSAMTLPGQTDGGTGTPRSDCRPVNVAQQPVQQELVMALPLL
ncbi:carboxypeptidase-like regulatory domain-containing protein [Corallococcus terminator]|uniref:Carboxypeptidase regulatory-like domain-containing protein n=1 Tax=Corallococcus terminator TaxID=2316733 RepID=A0A3A8IH49_9BACT|nr:carboxypeptidase-like regulatory domain-containing protein [Corallococcus terminator]RKG82712.1 carboxypeptidase regulatory-like domain-containing protein [Corallococcus terminator]